MILKDKVINFLGDSITEGCCVEDYYNRYDNILKRKYNLKEVYNYGIGGTRLAHQSVPSENPRYDLCFCGRAHTMNDDSDIIVVYGGVNDYIHGDAPIGILKDSTPATFCGAVNYLMKFLKENHTRKTIVFMTPAHCFFNGISDKHPSQNPIKKDDALPLSGYVDIIVKLGKINGIPVLNLYENLGLDPNDEDIRNEFTADGLHFNDKGQYYIAECLGKFLENL
jgi:lysophospholipase L1-like esterase